MHFITKNQLGIINYLTEVKRTRTFLTAANLVPATPRQNHILYEGSIQRLHSTGYRMAPRENSHQGSTNSLFTGRKGCEVDSPQGAVIGQQQLEVKGTSSSGVHQTAIGTPSDGLGLATPYLSARITQLSEMSDGEPPSSSLQFLVLSHS